MGKDQVTLRIDGDDAELAVVPGTVGDTGIDINKLRATTGKVTLDYGFANTAGCKSSITYVNGEEGILRYRGYPIEQLAESSSILEVA